ncbi:MAG: phosphotransferase [Vicinamibacteria bacterium]
MRRLPPGRLLARLVALGHVDPEWAADREVSLVDASRSNPVHLLAVDGEVELVVKQSGPAFDGVDSVASEKRALGWVESHLRERTLAPRMLAPSEDGLLVVEAVRASVPLHHVVAEGTDDARRAVLDLAGRLGALHRMAPDGVPTRSVPWALRLPEGPPEAIAHADGVREAVGAVGECRALVGTMRSLRARWRDQCMVHGDLKFDNVLVTGLGGALRCWLIDWELGAGGLPEWDAAGLVEGLLADALHGDATDDVLLRALVEAATDPLRCYRASADGAGGAPRAMLEALAVRVAQTAVQVVAMRAAGFASRPAETVPQLLRAAERIAVRAGDWAGRVACGRAA